MSAPWTEATAQNIYNGSNQLIQYAFKYKSKYSNYESSQ